MKKVMLMILCLCLCLVFSACNNNITINTGTQPTNEPQETRTVHPTAKPNEENKVNNPTPRPTPEPTIPPVVDTSDERYIYVTPKELSCAADEWVFFTATARGFEGDTRYMWEYKDDPEGWFNTFTADMASVAYGWDTEELSIKAYPFGWVQVRCCIYDELTETISEPATLTITDKFVVARQPWDQEITPGYVAYLETDAYGGVAPYKYYWKTLSEFDGWLPVHNDPTNPNCEFRPQWGGEFRFKCVIEDSTGAEIETREITVTAVE